MPKSAYKKMVELMQEKTFKNESSWFVYILQCKDQTFYTGITKNLERRIEQHNSGKGAKYTRTRGPVKLIYSEKAVNRSKALIRELKIKALPRNKKSELTGG